MLEQLGYVQHEPTTIFSDSQSAIALVHNPVQHQRSKHIDIIHHFTREMFEANVIDIKYVPTEDQFADILTKPLFAEKHWKCCLGLGLELCVRG
jgi:hypothetical protein